jgi:hypothetical protein
MSYPKFITSLGIVATLALVAPPTASAQARGRAVPRGSVRVVRPPVHVAPYRSYPYPNYYRPYYRPGVNVGFFYGRPGYYGSYAYGAPFYGFGFGVGYGYGYPVYGPAYGYAPYAYAPYGYGYGGYSGRPYGGVRIDLPQRDAEVYADGYFVGTVDDFDGSLQQANLEAGPHRIEIRDQNFETMSFNVNVEPGRTVTYRATMRPLQP